jgi:hypothetical protein
MRPRRAVTGRPLPSNDFQDICTLKAQYFRLLDTKDWHGWRQLFADDLVVYGTGQAGPHSVVFSSAEAFVSSVRAFVGGAITVHHGYTPELRLADDGSVRGTWAMSDLIERPETGRIYRGFGHYHETYRRLPDGWRISEFELVRLREYKFHSDAPR